MAVAGENTSRLPEPDRGDELVACPVCVGKMDIAYNGMRMKVAVCRECHTEINIPASAWDVARAKPQQS